MHNTSCIKQGESKIAEQWQQESELGWPILGGRKSFKPSSYLGMQEAETGAWHFKLLQQGEI